MAHDDTNPPPPRRLCVVIPAHNEAANLPAMTQRLVGLGAPGPGWTLEILYVDDGSRDDTAAVARQLRDAGQPVGLLRFSRNFGHQAAIWAGMAAAEADVVITMDADLQHPPEAIPAMLRAFEAGSDVVQMVRDKAQEGLKGWLSRTFYRVFNALSQTQLVADAPDFRLVSRRVIQALKDIPERDKFLRGLIPTLGFRQEIMPYEQAERFAGQASFGFKRSLKMARKALLDHSTLPLRFVFWMGLSMAMLSFTAGVSFVVVKLIWWNKAEPGFTDLIFAITFLSGCILASLGILGHYLSAVLDELRGRPTYVVESHVPPPRA